MNSIIGKIIATSFLGFFLMPQCANAQEISEDSSFQTRDGNLQAVFIISVPLSTPPSAFSQIVTDTLPGWMDTIAPPGSTSDFTLVHISVVIKKGIFTAYTFPVIIEGKDSDDSWEELLPTLVRDAAPSETDSASLGGGGGGESLIGNEFDAMDLMNDTLTFPPGAVIVINGSGSRGIVTCEPACTS